MVAAYDGVRSKTMKSSVIVLLLLTVIFLMDRIARLENQRYAMTTGICFDKDSRLPQMPDPECLMQVQMRTSWFWCAFQ